jgi:heparanase
MNTTACRLATVAVALFVSTNLRAQVLSVDPGKMTALGSVDERFQSYNIEMVEVTGGRFWKPYSSNAKSAGRATPTPQAAAPIAGLGSDLFEYRSPIDLSNSRLRKLATALGPAYVRVSGSWANSVYFQDSDGAAPATPPSGFGSVLTRKQWKGVIDFVRATDAQLVTSFAISPGTRDASGEWTPEQAGEVLAYTKSVGGRITAAEFMNEPNLPSFGGAPKGYDAAAYARDLAIFKPFLKQNSPETLLTGPGSTAEAPTRPRSPIPGFLTTDALLTATGPAFDVFDYHLYAAVSQRCAQRAPEGQTKAADALSPEWLSRSEKIAAFYGGLRDKYEPGKPIWITETADAACGGNPWASTFLDTFRYLIQHGRLAQMGVKVIMHNTLAASDYGLLDEKTFEPRPNYWAALLWRKFMGSTVLDPHVSAPENIYAYAHCLQGHPGGVALLVINADQQHTYQLNIPTDSERYTLTAEHLEDKTVLLDGNSLALRNNGDLPQLTGKRVPGDKLAVAPRSITFLAIASANNNACR